MTTRGAMMSEIAQELGRSDLSSENGPIHKKIEEAITDLQPLLFWFNEDDSQTFSTVEDQVEYDNDDVSDAPDWEDWYRLDHVFLEETSGKRHTLSWMPYEDVMLLTDNESSSSRPTSYCVKNNKLYLYPKPDGVYTIRLSGHYKIEPPAASGTTGNRWMTNGYQAVMRLAKSKLYAHHIKNYDMAKVEYIEHEKQLGLIRKQTTDKRATGRIQSDPF